MKEKMKTFIVLALIIFAIFFSSCLKPCSSQEGDIIFQESLSSQSEAIKLATKSKYSHMGILLKKDGKMYVFEAVQPVKYTPVKEWINRGKGGVYEVKRLINAKDCLTPEVLEGFHKEAKSLEGKNYDSFFEWSDDRIYCSELVWKLYKKATGLEIGRLNKFKEFDLTNPVVKSKLKERYGTKIPLNEPVISPESMLNSEKIVTIFAD